MISLGLDLSTHTGLVVLNDAGEDYRVPWKAKELSTKLTGYERLEWFRCEALAMVDEVKPHVVVVEGYSYAGKFNNAFQYELGAIVRQALWQSCHTPEIIPPTTLKKFVSGKGNANKDVMMLNVFKRWGFDPPTNNVADAYGLAMLGLHLLGVDVGLPKAHTDGIAKSSLCK